MKTTSILFILLSLIGFSVSNKDNETVKEPAVKASIPTVVIEEATPVLAGPVTEAADYTQIAQCLTTKGVKLYGAYWCPHCNSQKTMFGDAIQYVSYIECDAKGENGDPEACNTAGITAYPTWVNADKEQLTGSRDPQVVAEWAGC